MAHFLKLSLTPSPQDVPVVRSVDYDTSRCDRRLEDIRPEPVQIRPECHLVFHTAPETPAADRIRYLRMHLRNLQTSSLIKTVLITSPNARDGKTMVGMNLATALADEGKARVLLLEADLHHAPVTGRLGLSPGKGLSDCLEGEVDPFSVLRRPAQLGWYFMPAGRPRSNPAELLQNKAYESLLNPLRDAFDWVLIDSPPVTVVTDALFLRQHADTTLLVVRAGQTPQSAVDEAIQQIGQHNLAAVVLNAVQGLERVYYKQGAAYYTAGSQPQPESE